RHSRVWEWLQSVHRALPGRTVFSKSTYPFRGLDLNVPGLDTSFAELSGHACTEALYVAEQSPSLLPSGYVLGRWGALDERGVIDHNRWVNRRPGLRRVALLRAGRRVKRIETALSLRTLGERNYYHFLNDIVGGTLRIARQGEVSADVPLVISERMAQTPFI